MVSITLQTKVQWNLSNTDTTGTKIIVLINKVSLFWPNFLYRVKVNSNECPPWSELRMVFEKHSPKCYAYLR